ncbi:hypothetical protein ABPG75_011237 [Micractinium tetrahymenae]
MPALAAVLLCAAAALPLAIAAASLPLAMAAAPPNIIFVLTDDADAMHGGDWHMPKMRQYLSDHGINFTQAVVNFPLCCPSRATILTGMCAHNTRTITNAGNELGGFPTFMAMQLANKTGPFVLQQGGYRTGLFGKFLNGYRLVDYSIVPAGFTRWFGIGDPLDYIQWAVSDQGVTRRFGSNETDYSTDVIANEAEKFILEAAADPRPFFAMIAPYAPHPPYLPALRHRGSLAGLKMPRSPAFNESAASIQKKTSFIKQMPPIPMAWDSAYDFVYQLRAESLLAVDDMVERVVQALNATGQLDNTYIFYSSDNGVKLGHRRMLNGKQGPYEEDVRVPLHVRLPGATQGIKLPHLVSNIDFVPTWIDLAGVADPYEGRRDGISFAPLLRGEPAALANPSLHRTALIIEKLAAGGGDTRVSTMVPLPSDAADDVFPGPFRPHLLPNGSFPYEVLDWERRQDSDFLAQRRRNYMGSPYLPQHTGSMAGWREFLAMGPPNNISVEALIRTDPGYWPGPYYALRTLTYKYIEWQEGYELYNLQTDPWELNNIFDTAPRALLVQLQSALQQLKTCRGESCRFRQTSSAFPNPINLRRG